MCRLGDHPRVVKLTLLIALIFTVAVAMTYISYLTARRDIRMDDRQSGARRPSWLEALAARLLRSNS